MHHSIGIFDSGFGGLTVLKEIIARLPQYDYLYLGDNARTPYGNRSFETVYQYTLQCVKWFFQQGCPLVILACNTASAKALRSIQQRDLPGIYPNKKVLGVIRPTTEVIGQFTNTGHIGVLATAGTVLSGSYEIEINKFFPGIQVFQEACPIWVPLIENNEYNNVGADYFIKQHVDRLMQKSPAIDTILLACTHYPLIQDKINTFLPAHVNVLSQGKIVADSLGSYLERHQEVEILCSKQSKVRFFTTDSVADFNRNGSMFFGRSVLAAYAGFSS